MASISRKEESNVYSIRVNGGIKYKGPYGEIFIPDEDVDIEEEEEEEEDNEENLIEEDKLETFSQENVGDKQANDNMDNAVNVSSFSPYEENFNKNDEKSYIEDKDIDNKEDEEDTEENSNEEDKPEETFSQESISDKQENDNKEDDMSSRSNNGELFIKNDEESCNENKNSEDEEEEKKEEGAKESFIEEDKHEVIFSQEKNSDKQDNKELKKDGKEKVEKEKLKNKDITTEIKIPSNLKITKVIIKKGKRNNLVEDEMDDIYAKDKGNHSDKRNVTLSKKGTKHSVSLKKERDLSEKDLETNIPIVKQEVMKLENYIKNENLLESYLEKENPPERNYKCRWCLHVFSYELDLVRHVKTHSKEDKFPCGECNKIFPKSSNRDVHLRNVHKLDDRQFSCKWCLETFADKCEKDIHLQAHKKGDSFSCNICQKIFLRCDGRNAHLRTHTGQQRWRLLEKQFQCSQCPMTCSRINALQIHSQIHSGEKPHSCGMCPKSFAQISNLNAHMKIHTGEKNYTCNQCEKSFSQKIGLNRHIQMHLGIKNINCNECSKSFASKQSLRGHMKIHTGVKNYTCELCPKQFYNSQGMKKHVKRTHTDIKSEKNYTEDDKLKETFSHGNMKMEVDENGTLCSPNGENVIQNYNKK